MNILLVDDDPDILVILGRAFKKRGHMVIPFGDGLSAIEFLEQDGRCDLIFTDTNMPKMDGFGFTRRVKADYPEIPVVMMTTSPTAHWLERCKALKADFCLLNDKTEEAVLTVLEQFKGSET
jgi:CheY-like chemotaxis protein